MQGVSLTLGPILGRGRSAEEGYLDRTEEESLRGESDSSKSGRRNKLWNQLRSQCSL